MNVLRVQCLLLLICPCMGLELATPARSEQPRILLPLNLDKVPPAKVLLDELKYYLGNDGDNNYGSNTRAIEHHLLLLQEHYPEEAQDYVSQMPIWTHSEHFLERLPRFFLDTLVELKWRVHPDALEVALNKLNSLLPQDPHDMIDCAAGKPMGQIIRLLAAQRAKGIEAKAMHYTQSQDQDLAYAAYCALLSLQDMAEPTVAELVQQHWAIKQASDLAQLSEEEAAIAKLITVHEGALTGEFESWVSVDLIVDAMDYLQTLQLPDYAEALACFIHKDEQSGQETLVSGDDLHMASIEYSCLAQPSPRNIIAKRLLDLLQSSSTTSHSTP